jgi:putative DNA primase/helicase
MSSDIWTAQIKDAAISYRDCGLSTIPCSKDEKKPVIASWKPYQESLPEEFKVDEWFSSPGRAIAIITGRVSGDCEMLDFDCKGVLYDLWKQLVDDQMPGLVDKLVIERSQSDGRHIAYRCPGLTIPGSQKLSQRAIDVTGETIRRLAEMEISIEDAAGVRKALPSITIQHNGKGYVPKLIDERFFLILTLIETRGEGGYFLCAPSQGYSLIQGDFQNLPNITPEERQILFEAALSLNEWLDPAKIERGEHHIHDRRGDPGDDFNKRGDPAPILKEEGWLAVGRPRTVAGTIYQLYRRPGKRKGQSATLIGGKVLHVFTSNGYPFKELQSYSPFAIYALTKCEGNFTQAAKELLKQGYGETRSKAGVPGVPGVQSNTDADLDGNTGKDAGVPGVPKPFPEEGKRPCYCVYDFGCGPDGKNQPGVYHHYMTKGKKEEPPAPVNQWLSDPIHVDAVTRDHHGNNHGFMLRFRNRDKEWKFWNMPARLLDGGDELRRELLNQGLFLDIKNKPGVPCYINAQHPESRMRAALQVGWYGNDFVLPTRVIGAGGASEPVFFQSEEAGNTDYSTHGSLDDWRSHVAARCTGNPILTFCISATFAGPLLKLCNVDGAAFHFFGDSTSGKTTCSKAAAATWGAWKEYMRSWKATANGLEGAACLFSDGLLVLDELSDGSGQEVEKSIYALVNGKGKQRAHVTGSAKTPRSWRILTLSNGERTLEAHLAAYGLTVKAGQLVRLLQIPVFGEHGVFADLHGYPDGKALSDALADGASKYYGTAGIAYLEKLTAAVQSGEDIATAVKEIAKLITNDVKDTLSPQEGRAVMAFALVAAGGELATEFGVTGWQPGAAIEAARKCFNQWRDHRGRGNVERNQILTMLSEYISRWGDARFSSTEDDKPLHGPRGGYWRDAPGIAGEMYREWLFTSAGIKDAVPGYEMKQISSALVAAGWLVLSSSDNKKAQALSIQGKKTRYYVLRIPEDYAHAS